MTLNFKKPIFTVIAVIFMDVNNIASIVRFHRKKSGPSQMEIAKLAGVGKTVVFDIEKGKLSVRLDTLLKVLNVLNIQIELHSQLMSLYKESLNEKG